jgi:hypothetical protein
MPSAGHNSPDIRPPSSYVHVCENFLPPTVFCHHHSNSCSEYLYRRMKAMLREATLSSHSKGIEQNATLNKLKAFLILE